MIFNVSATMPYINTFITFSVAVDIPEGTHVYYLCAAASFFACLVMIANGVGAVFGFQAW